MLMDYLLLVLMDYSLRRKNIINMTVLVNFETLADAQAVQDCASRFHAQHSKEPVTSKFLDFLGSFVDPCRP